MFDIRLCPLHSHWLFRSIVKEQKEHNTKAAGRGQAQLASDCKLGLSQRFLAYLGGYA